MSDETELWLALTVANATAVAISQPRPDGAKRLFVTVDLSRQMANALGCEPRQVFPVDVPRSLRG